MTFNANDPIVELVRLSTVRDRRVCCITGFHLPADDQSRLKNMGICVGRRIEVLQFGDPLIVKVSGTNVGIARRLAVGIEIRTSAELDRETSPWSKSDSATVAPNSTLHVAAIA